MRDTSLHVFFNKFFVSFAFKKQHKIKSTPKKVDFFIFVQLLTYYIDMKKLIIPFFCAALFSTPAMAQQKTTATEVKTQDVQAQAQKIIDKYLIALGGKEKLNSVNSLFMEGSMTVMGQQLDMVVKKMGNKMYSEQTMMGQAVGKQIFDGEKGYMEQMGRKIDFNDDQIAGMKKGQIIEALGIDISSVKKVTTETSDGKKYDVLETEKATMYFDSETGLMYKTIAGPATVIFKEYMTVDGIKFPSVMETEAQGMEMKLKQNKILVNSGVTEVDFKY